MKKFKLILFVSLFFALNGLGQKEEIINCEVRPINLKMNIDGHQLLYALPKNTIHVTIIINQTIETPGPYSNFADKYLNITDGVLQLENIFYEVAHTSFERNSYPDSSCYFCISCLGSTNIPFLQLNADGVILGSNLPYAVEEYKIAANPVFNLQGEPEQNYFYDLGVKRFVDDNEEEAPKNEQSDSLHVKSPVSINKLVAKTEEQNAMEAANFIMKLRKRRLKLLVGLKDEAVAVEGDAMRLMVSELDNLEEKYLELFVGKTKTRELIYHFDFEPESSIEAEQKIIGWFSPNSGFVYSKPDIRKNDFKPIILKSEVLGKIPEVTIQTMDNSAKNSVPIKYGLYYRVPGMVSISLQYLDQIISIEKVQIAQKGRLIPLPSEYLNSNKYGIEFNPETGALKKIIQIRLE